MASAVALAEGLSASVAIGNQLRGSLLLMTRHALGLVENLPLGHGSGIHLHSSCKHGYMDYSIN